MVVELLHRRQFAQLEERQRAGDAWTSHVHAGRTVDLVFTTTTGGLVLRQAVTKAIATAATSAGIDPRGLGTHAGRSTAITVLYAEEGLDLADIARHVGHAAPATTSGYVATSGAAPPRRRGCRPASAGPWRASGPPNGVTRSEQQTEADDSLDLMWADQS